MNFLVKKEDNARILDDNRILLSRLMQGPRDIRLLRGRDNGLNGNQPNVERQIDDDNGDYTKK